MRKLQDKVKEIYDRLGSEFYLCRDDFEVNGERFNSALLMGSLTELNRGNMLLFGEYGGGKTTSAEYLNAAFNGLPLDLVKIAGLRGHPQLTTEHMIAVPNYGAMNSGDPDWARKSLFSYFALIGEKLLDEGNRIPESTQSSLLTGLDIGLWTSLRTYVFHGKKPFFITCNYSDRGNNTLIPPMLDRCDVAVESKFPGVSNKLHIAKDYRHKRDSVLSNPELTKRALDILHSATSYDEARKGLEGITSEHSSALAQEGFPVLTREDRERIEDEIEVVEFDRDAEQYLSFFEAERNTHPKYGLKRSCDPVDKSHGLYLNSLTTNAGSQRETDAIVKYAKSLAWLQDQDEVNLDHVTQVAPYVLWHRIKWTPETEQAFRDHDRADPSDLYITKTLLNDGTNEIPGVKKRFAESQENYQRVIDLVGHGKLEKAIEETKEYFADGRGHPIFMDLIKDLGVC